MNICIVMENIIRFSVSLLVVLSLSSCGSGAKSTESTDAGSPPPAVPLAPTPTALAQGLYSPFAVAVDSANVYFTVWGTSSDFAGLSASGSVNKVGKDGGAVTPLASGLERPRHIAVDSTSVYWTGSNAINKVDVNGGSVVSIATVTSPVGIALDASYVYWMDITQSVCEIKKVGKNGGTVNVLFSGTNFNNNCGSFAIDSSNVYWFINNEFSPGTAAIKKMSLSGGAGTTITTTLGFVGSITVDSTDVYWTENAGAIQYVMKKVGKNGGTVSTLAQGLGNDFNGISSVITTDSSDIYWGDSNSIRKIGNIGGTATNLAAEDLAWAISSLAVDSTSVYWTAPVTVGGAILKVAK